MEHRELLSALVRHGASDLHCRPGSVPVMRRGGELVREGDTPFTAEDVAKQAGAMLTTEQQQELLRSGSVVGAHSEPGVGRFRVAAYRQRGSVAMVVHVVPDDVPKLDDLGLPTAATTLAAAPKGLVLVASPVGNGGTTTLGALVDHVNSTQRRHIVTVEDPIEVLHRDGIGMVSQLEVGADVPTIADGIRVAAKLDADVIAVSDVSERATGNAVLEAVARGRLVLAGIGGYSVLSAIHTFLELFSVEEREIARAALSRGLAGILAQRLLPTVDGELVAAVESLVHTTKIQQCIAEPDRLQELHGLIEEGEYHGMQTMDAALVLLVRAGRIAGETAISFASDPEDLRIELLR